MDATIIGLAPSPPLYNMHRWYEPFTGRYGRPDPLTSLRSTHLYTYANAIPTRLFDPLGLAVATGACTSSQTAQIQIAASQADAASEKCLPCEDKEPFRNKIRNLTVKCIPARYTARTGTPICGKAFGYNDAGEYVRYERQIDLSPAAFDPNASSECGCLKGLILHEVTHLLGYEDAPGPKNSYDAASNCFSCAKSNPFVFGASIDVD